MSEGMWLLAVLGGIVVGFPVFDVFRQHRNYRKFLDQVRTLMEAERFTDARDILEKEYSKEAIPKGDPLHLTRVHLAQCYMNEERFEDALRQLRFVAGVFEKNQRIGNWTAKVVLSQHAATREMMAECFTGMGDDASRDQERRRSGELYNAAGHTGYASYLFGYVRNDIGDYERAITSFQESLAALEKSPDADDLRNNALLHLGISQSLAGHNVESSQSLREFLEQSSEHSMRGTAYALLASVSTEIGEPEEGLKNLEKSFEFSDSHEYCRLTRARMLASAGRLREARAEAVAARGITGAKRLSDSFSMEADYASRSGDWSNAELLSIKALEEIKDPSPRARRFQRASVVFLQSTIYREQGRFAEALVALDEAEPDIVWHPRQVWASATLRLLLNVLTHDSSNHTGDIEALQRMVADAVGRFDNQEDGIRYHDFALMNLARAHYAAGEWGRGRHLIDSILRCTKTACYRAKYLFLIAQCYEVQGDMKEASELYHSAANCETEERHRQLAQNRLLELSGR